jgi:hypothetical protein
MIRQYDGAGEQTSSTQYFEQQSDAAEQGLPEVLHSGLSGAHEPFVHVPPQHSSFAVQSSPSAMHWSSVHSPPMHEKEQQSGPVSQSAPAGAQTTPPEPPWLLPPVELPPFELPPAEVPPVSAPPSFPPCPVPPTLIDPPDEEPPVVAWPASAPEPVPPVSPLSAPSSDESSPLPPHAEKAIPAISEAKLRDAVIRRDNPFFPCSAFICLAWNMAGRITTPR